MCRRPRPRTTRIPTASRQSPRRRPPAAPAGSAILLGGMTVGRLGGETAIGSLLADAVLVPVLRLTDGRRGTLAGAGVVAVMLAKRLAGNAPVPKDRKARTYVNRLVF